MDGSFKLIFIAMGLLVLGVALPMLMVLGYIGSTLFLNFVSALSSTGGLMIGFVGIAQYVRARK